MQEQGAIERELRQTKHRHQRIEQQIKYLQDGERKKRTHRLIIKGAVIESVAPTVKDMGEREFYLWGGEEGRSREKSAAAAAALDQSAQQL